jgi:hypothetical protein
MGLGQIYLEAARSGIFPTVSTMQSLWNEWLWGSDCNAMIDEDTGDMNSMHIFGILLALLESMQIEGKECEEDSVESLLPFIPLVHLYKKPIAEYTLRELTSQVCLFCVLKISW